MNDQPSFLLPKKSKKIHCGKAAQSSSSAIDCPNRTLSCAHHVVLSPSSIKQESTRSLKSTLWDRLLLNVTTNLNKRSRRQIWLNPTPFETLLTLLNYWLFHGHCRHHAIIVIVHCHNVLPLNQLASFLCNPIIFANSRIAPKHAQRSERTAVLVRCCNY